MVVGKVSHYLVGGWMDDWMDGYVNNERTS